MAELTLAYPGTGMCQAAECQDYRPCSLVWSKLILTLTVCLQVLADVGGKNFVGVNYCAMNKYGGPKTKEQWDTVVKNLKVLSQYNACHPGGTVLTRCLFIYERPELSKSQSATCIVCLDSTSRGF